MGQEGTGPGLKQREELRWNPDPENSPAMGKIQAASGKGFCPFSQPDRASKVSFPSPPGRG